VKRVPAWIVNEHNEAFFYWQKARIDGLLPEALDLFHIDAHDDMGRPKRFNQSLYFQPSSGKDELDFYQQFARTELNISNFIFPGVLLGLIRNIYFVYPPWRPFKPARRKWSVCSAFGEGIALKYDVKADARNDRLIGKAFPDLKTFSFISGKAERLPRKRRVILDIDMDYFACRDSTQNFMAYELEITRGQFENQDTFMADNTLPFSGLDFDFVERQGRCFARVSKNKVEETSHMPSEEEVVQEIDALVEVLRKKQVRPMVITLCRSCNSGFCPDDYSQFIEPVLMEKLLPLITTT
jgi:hypothetical protein